MRVPHRYTPRTQRASGGLPAIQNRTGIETASAGALVQDAATLAKTLSTAGGLLTEQATQARRFGTLQSFNDFQTAVDTQLEEMKRNADPRLGNFADQAAAVYNNLEQDWLKTVPDEFYDEFKTRASDVKGRVIRDSLAFQFERTDAYFRQGIADQVNASLLSLDQDGGVENLERNRALVDEFINSTTLTEAEKVQLRRQAYTALESTSYKSEVRRGNIETSALGVGAAPGRAVDLILEFEGPSLEDNGLTYAENRDLLQQRAQAAEQIAVEALGDAELWNALPERARGALTSLVDDEGELPQSVKDAIATGDLEAVAAAVAELGGERRETEAEIILGLAEMPEGMIDADPRYANIPYEDRVALREDAEREAAAEIEAAAKREKQARDTAINDLMVALHDGAAGQFEIDQARESGILTDIEDIERAQRLLEDKDNLLRMVAEGQARIEAGLSFNPGNDRDRDILNAMFGQEGIAGLQTMDAPTVTNVLVPLVRQSKDIPTDAVGLLTGMMRSDDPQRAAFALDSLSQLQQASPEAYDARVNEDVAAAVEYWRTAKDYYPLDEVMASVRGGTTQEERVREEALRAQARTMLTKGEVQVDLLSELDTPSFLNMNGDPLMLAGAKVGLNRDFQQLFEREFARDGNVEAAKKRAVTALGRVWKTTDVGGQRQLMKYPPEAVGYKRINDSYEWMTQQARSELGLADNVNFQLISDEQTRAEVQAYRPGEGPPPSYLIVYPDENGNLTMPTDDFGQPARIYFEVTPEMEAAELAEFNNQRIRREYQEFMTRYNSMLHVAIQAGGEVPPELQQEYADWQERIDALP